MNPPPRRGGVTRGDQYDLGVMSRFAWTAIVLTCCLCSNRALADRDVAPAPVEFTGSSLPTCPDLDGVSGAIMGRSGEWLIIAGGVRGSEVGTRAFALNLSDAAGGWRELVPGLPWPVAHAVAIADPMRGTVIVGGGDGIEATPRAALLTTDGVRLTTQPLPDLPIAVMQASGALIGDTVVVVGGQSAPGQPPIDQTWLLDLGTEVPTWRGGQSIPNGGVAAAVTAVYRGDLYLFSGVLSGVPNGAGLTDSSSSTPDRSLQCWRYRPLSDEWTQLHDMPIAAVVSPTPALPVGCDLLAVLGAGEDGNQTLTYHPGTDRWSVRDAASSQWSTLSRCAVALPGPAAAGGGTQLLIAITPGAADGGGPFMQARPIVAVNALAALDWLVIALYLGAVLAMGIWFARKKTSTDEFFLAGRRIPWWAAGISIFATSVSAITFMAIPAKAWDSDWTYFLQNLGVLVVAPFAALVLVPRFRRLEVTTAYEYLEHRFHWSLRLAASALYMLFQVGRVAVVTLLPALALSAVTGMDTMFCIMLMGLVTILYTSLGGIEAVIWSDVVQAVILFGGAIWALCVMVGGSEGGLSGLWADAAASGKLHYADWSMDLTRGSVLVMVLGAVFTNLIPYASDQSIVQRYLSVRDEREAKKAVLGGAILSIPASLLFFALGTALWGFYRANPDRLDPTAQLDQIFPFFIVNEMPAGLAGLVLAGLFAAAMSSLDSAMNSVATAFTTDWYRRFRPESDDAKRLRVARTATVVIGIVGTGAAIIMARRNDPSLLDLWFKVIGLFGSGVAGVFLLGALTKRTGVAAGWAGLVAGAGSVWAVGAFTSLSGLAYSAVGVLACLVAGIMVGFMKRGARTGAGDPHNSLQ